MVVNLSKACQMSQTDTACVCVCVVMVCVCACVCLVCSFTYMHVMYELEQLFGTAIPDVEFVIASGDK